MAEFDVLGFVEGEPPFPAEEYADCLRRTRVEMACRDIDLLYVSSPPNITWLTGYDMLWYRRATPTGLVVRQDRDTTLFYDSAGHKGLIEAGAFPVGEVVLLGANQAVESKETEWPDSVDRIVGDLRARGWLKGRAAVEHWATAPGSPVLRHIERRLGEAGCATTDGSWLVDRVRLRHSPRELAVLHRAAAAADEVMQVVRGALHEGMIEVEIQGLVQHELAKRGCEEAALRTALRSGERRGEAHHALPTLRNLQRGDIVIVDFSACLKRYHVDILRCFAIGDCDTRWHGILEKAAGSLDAVAAEVRPGEPMEKVVAVARRYLEEQGILQHAWFVDGYTQGLTIPPDWVGHVYLGGDGFERSEFETGITTNYENVFDIRGWPGGSCISYIDMIEMTEAGLVALSKLPRTLNVV